MLQTESALVFDTIKIFAETIQGLGEIISLLRLRNQRRCEQDYKKSIGGTDALDDNILNTLLDVSMFININEGQSSVFARRRA